MSLADTGKTSSDTGSDAGSDAGSAGVLGSSAVMAAGTVVSRLSGFVRGTLLATALGLGLHADVFNIANTVPNMLYILLAGGVFNAVLVPQLVRAMRNDADGGEAYTSRVITLAALFLAAVTVVLVVAAPLLMRLYLSGAYGEPALAAQRASAIAFARYCLPQVFFYGMFVLVGQILNSRRSFGPMMWAPIANNVVSVAVLVGYLVAFGHARGNPPNGPFSSPQELVLGLGSTLGIVVQLLILVPYLKRAGFTYRPRFDFRGSGLGHTLRLGVWTVLFVIVNQVAYTIVVRLASAGTAQAAGSAGGGSEATGYTIYSNAFLVTMVPHAIVTVSLATAMLPRLSSAAAELDLRALGAGVASMMRTAYTVIVPVALLIPVVALDVANVTYGYGAARRSFALFGPTLSLFAIGLFFFTSHYLVLRGFYALEKTRLVFYVQCAVAAVNVVAALALTRGADPAQTAPRLVIAYSAAYAVGAVVSFALLRRLVGGLEGARLARFMARLVLAALVAAGLAWAARSGVHLALGREGKLAAVAALAAAGIIDVVAFVLLARVLRIAEVTDVVDLVAARLGRRRGGGGGAARRPGPPVGPSPRIQDVDPDQSVSQQPEGEAVTTSILPGTVLGGRYRLVDLLDDVDGAKSWRAVDQVLERSVAAFVVDRDDPRAGPLLDAARRSATVTDPHLLRVLDADSDDRLAWVINEWGAGQSLDTMVAHEVLPADRAAWLVREVAAAIAVAHGHGLAHGRLCPENIMVTESGTVRLIGFALDATIQTDRLRSGNYPGCTALEADLFDLAGLLYAGLVGCWPGASGSSVKAAPRDARGPLRPRQVRAGVPQPLDAICGRVLGRGHPDRTARQLSAVLTEYLGELAVADPTVLPVSLPEMDSSLDDLAALTGHTDPEAQALHAARPLVAASPEDTTPPLVTGSLPPGEPSETGEPGETGEPVAETAWQDVAWADEDTAQVSPLTDATQVTAVITPAVTAAKHRDEAPGDETQRSVFEAGRTDPAATDPAQSDPSQSDPAATDPDWHRPRPEAGPPAPPLDPLPERPLFAPEGARRTPRGEVRRSATTDWGTEVAAARLAGAPELPVGAESPEADAEDEDDGWSVLPAQRRPSWPLGSDDADGVPDDWEERTRRSWLRLPLVVVVLLVVAVLVAGGLTLSRRDDTRGGTSSGGAGDPTTSPTAQASAGQRLRIAGVKDLDPFGVPAEENPGTAANAADGDPNTSWQTVTYRGRPDLGGLKPGVGMVVDLGSIQRVGSVDLTLVGSPTDLSLFAAPTASGAPTGIEGLQRLVRRTDTGVRTTLDLTQPVRARYLVVWLTSLPPVQGGYRGGIAEIVVRS